MKFKAVFGSTKKYNLIMLSAFPIFFILMGLLSFISDTAKNIFFSLSSIYNVLIDEKHTIIFSVISSYYFVFISHFLLMCVNIAAWILYRYGKIKFYKYLECSEYVIWNVIMIIFFIYFGISYIYSWGIICAFILYIPTLFLLLRGMEKTASIKIKQEK